MDSLVMIFSIILRITEHENLQLQMIIVLLVKILECTDEETEDKRGEIRCLSSHGELGLKSRCPYSLDEGFFPPSHLLTISK